MMRFGSLFSGIGGFDLGFERAGMECAWQVEIDDYCRRVLAKHWPDVRRYEDVRKCGKHNLEPVDIITGGTPCQPHSVAGKRAGAADDRDLWPEYRRIIAELRPRWVIGENVPGIRTTILDQVLSDLEDLDYTTGTIIIPACAFDAPHIRSRVFVVGYTNSRRRQQCDQAERAIPEFDQGSADVHECDWWQVESGMDRVVNGVSSALDGTIRRFGYEDGNDKKTVAEIDRFRREILRRMREEKRQTKQTPYREERESGQGALYEVSYLRAHERWKLGQRFEKDEELQNMWQHILAEPFEKTHHMQQRMLERVREKERHEKVGASRVDRLRALGNAVVPQVAEWIGRRIMEAG